MENSRFKFRVWDKRYSKYYYDAENTFEENQVLGIDYFGQYLNDDDFIVEQCTSLKDKNGNLIYAGDIVNESFLGKTVVKWLDDKCGFNISKIFKYNDGRCQFESESYYEIIGNIHENPELLEDK